MSRVVSGRKICQNDIDSPCYIVIVQFKNCCLVIINGRMIGIHKFYNSIQILYLDTEHRGNQDFGLFANSASIIMICKSKDGNLS